MRQELRVDPRPVAFARICIGIAAISLAVEGNTFLITIVDGRLAVPVVSWWPGPSELPLRAMLFIGMLAGVFLAIGCCAKWCAALIAALQVVMVLSDQQLYSSHRILLFLLCCHLVFAQSDAAWSLRARYQGRRPSVPLGPQVLMIGAISSLYLFAGISKINGVFLSGDVLRDQMVIHLDGAFYHLIAGLTVGTEIFLGLGLWFRRTRLLAVMVGVALHISIIALLGDPVVLSSFGLLCVGLYPMVLSRPLPERFPMGEPRLRPALRAEPNSSVD